MAVPDSPAGRRWHGYSINEIKEWRSREQDAGRPSGLGDFCRAHGICPKCRGEGRLVIGLRWRDRDGIERAEAGLIADVLRRHDLVNPASLPARVLGPLHEACGLCGGTGNFGDLGAPTRAPERSEARGETPPSPAERQTKRLRSLAPYRGFVFRWQHYKTRSPAWDHDHCHGCWAQFVERPEEWGVHVHTEGWVTLMPLDDPGPQEPLSGAGYVFIPSPKLGRYQLDWVCPECFEACRQELGFVVDPNHPQWAKAGL